MDIQVTLTIDVEKLPELLNSNLVKKIAINEELVKNTPSVGGAPEFTDLNNECLKIRFNKDGSKTLYYKTNDKRTKLGNTNEMPFYAIKERYFELLGYEKELTISSFIKKEVIPDFYNLKEKTKRDYNQYINTYILPTFGSRAIKDITIRDIKKLHQAMKDSPYQANRVLGMLKKIFKQAIMLKVYSDENPCIHIKPYKEIRCNRFLSEQELDSLQNSMQIIDKDTDHVCKYMINFLLYSGVRLSEMFSMKNEDFKDDIITWKDTKTGEKTLPLVGKMKAMFYRLKDIELVSEKTLRRYFKSRLDKAGIQNFRLHDLRHTFATYALKSGASLEHVKRILNHRNISTTTRYCHLDCSDMKMTLSGTEKCLNH